MNSRNSSFPTLLEKKATLIGSLDRIDFLVIGSSYLLLSGLKVSGIAVVLMIIVILFLMRLYKKWIMPGFFRHLLFDGFQKSWTQNLNHDQGVNKLLGGFYDK